MIIPGIMAEYYLSYGGNMVLGMHMDGTDGSSGPFIDVKGHTVLPTVQIGHANAMTISSTQYQFGGTSAKFRDPTNSYTGYLTIPPASEFNITTGDFTIQAWVYIQGNSPNDSASKKQACIVSYNDKSTSNTSSWSFLIEGDGSTTGTGLRFTGTYGVDHVFRAASSPISQRQWHFLEASVKSGVGYLFIDGTSQTITTNNYIAGSMNNANPLLIGYEPYTSYLWNLNGYIDDLQIYNTCLHTTSYTPPTSAFIYP